MTCDHVTARPVTRCQTHDHPFSSHQHPPFSLLVIALSLCASGSVSCLSSSAPAHPQRAHCMLSGIFSQQGRYDFKAICWVVRDVGQEVA